MVMIAHGAPNPASSVIADMRAKAVAPAGQNQQKSVQGYASGTSQVAPNPAADYAASAIAGAPNFVDPNSSIAQAVHAAQNLFMPTPQQRLMDIRYAPMVASEAFHNLANTVSSSQGALGRNTGLGGGQPAAPAAAPVAPPAAVSNAGFLAHLAGLFGGGRAAPAAPQTGEQPPQKPAAAPQPTAADQLFAHLSQMSNAELNQYYSHLAQRPTMTDQISGLALGNMHNMVQQYKPEQQAGATNNFLLSLLHANPMQNAQATAMTRGMQ